MIGVAFSLLFVAAQASSGGSAAPFVPVPSFSGLSSEHAIILYDQCLARAAGKASRTDMPEDAIYPAAKSACAPVRSMLLKDQDASSERAQALDEIDRERAATFPERTREFRQMLRKHQLDNGAAE